MKKWMLILSCLFLSIGFSIAQSTRISGVVVDDTGEAVIGASVVVKGSTTGTITDVDGNFSLNVPQGSKTLVVSLIGMNQKEVSPSQNMRIVMSPDTELLDEVMVVAYGTAKRSAFTGAASVINASEISKRQASNVSKALAGQVAGVQVLSNNGQPGTSAPIRIRGVGSMNASSAPLYVVDGIPYDGDISAINNNDIESTTILKDAASNALYGARGANGVILITTKRGNSDVAKITVDAKWGTNRRGVSNYDVLGSPATYYEKVYESIYNAANQSGYSHDVSRNYALTNIFSSKNGGTGYQVYTAPTGESVILDNGKLNPNAALGYSDGKYFYTPDNWYDEAFDSGNLRQEYNVNISGKSDKMTYYMSVGFLDDSGIIESSGFERMTSRLNTDYQAKKWLKVGASMGYTKYKSDYPSDQTTSGSSGNLFYIANMMAPIYPMYVRDADGNIMHDNSGRTIYDFGDGISSNNLRPFMNKSNPMSALQLDVNDYNADVFSGKWFAEVTFLEGLKGTFNYGINVDNTRRRRLNNKFYGQYAADNGYVYVSQTRTYTKNSQALLTYNKSIQKHSFDILAGYEVYKYRNQFMSGSRKGLYESSTAELDNGVGDYTSSSYLNSFVTKSILSRFQYDYDGEYFGSFSYRRDGSSRFHKDHRWGNFWSLGGAWLLSKNVLASTEWIDMLKFKASFGQQGNDNLLDVNGNRVYYAYTDLYEVQPSRNSSISYIGNKNISWEKSNAFNTGFDFDLFKGKLSGTIEYFNRETKNMLYNVTTSGSMGYTKTPTNMGSMTNQGLEVDLHSNIIKTKDLLWRANFNLTFFKNKLNELPPSYEGRFEDGSRVYQEGKSMYQFFTRRYAGVNEDGEATYYVKATDNDGNEYLDTTADWAAASRFDSGDILPDVYGGFGTSVDYKGFDFSISFAYQLGGKIYDNTYAALMHGGNADNAGINWHKDILNSWTAENTNTSVPRVNSWDEYTNSLSDRFITSSDYLSIQNITLGYTLPKNITQKLEISNLRVYLVADNVALFAARKGLDPRIGYAGVTSGATYSVIRSISGGVSLTF